MVEQNWKDSANKGLSGSRDAVKAGLLKKDGAIFSCNGIGLKNLLAAGTQWLELHVEEVNRLNVYPVPDGDTGTNMLITMRAAVGEAGQVNSHNVGTVAAAAAHGALMGARGNSGVILSQFLQGVADGFDGKIDFNATELTQAVKLGVNLACQSVVEPVEGTILTVARATADAGERSAKRGESLEYTLGDMVKAAKIAQADTPRLLPVLKEAGVTDSGGQGFLYILEGGLRYLLNQPVDSDFGDVASPMVEFVSSSMQSYPAYDVQFLIEGQQLNIAEIRAHIDRLGQSTVVVGNERVVKIHVHIDDPGLPLSYGAGLGQISDVVVENLHRQVGAFVEARNSVSTANIEVVSVVQGTGLKNIFRSLGVKQVIEGGQTLNLDVQDVLFAIEQAKVENVLVLPNNKDVILTAQQALALADKNVRIVPTQTVPQGIAALLSFNDKIGLDANVRQMMNAAGQVETIEITKAVNNTQINGFNISKGQFIGFFNGKLSSVGWGDLEVALNLLAQTTPENFEIITIYFGENCTASQGDALVNELKKQYPLVDVEVYSGGQPFYHYIISLE